MNNFQSINTFDKGHSTDHVENVESNKTFVKGVNGRLYSHNGKISFTNIVGSKLIYENANIVKYLGYYSFKDEIIIFVKSLKIEGIDPVETEVTEINVESNYFEILTFLNNTDPVFVNNEFSENSEEVINTYTTVTNPLNPADFSPNFSCADGGDDEVDFGEYYGLDLSVPNFTACNLNDNVVPINNLEYFDAIYSLKPDNAGNLTGTLLWIGYQNWPMNAKITTEGVDENQYYKRVYYTDAFNYRRVVNIKDKNLLYRNGEEFNQILNNTLLQPEIVSIQNGGQLNAMKSMYIYRIISENGQVSEFSPVSYFAQVIPEVDAIEYRGGNISENTGKYVTIKCNLINPEPTAQIQCIALEFEAFGTPTGIKNLGTKQANNVVYFDHYGNENQFAENITYQDIIEFKNTWKYCNDFTSKKNKLIAGGLRNDPLPTIFNQLDYLMPLHSWKANGDTHECLMNPEPWEYRYIDPSFTGSLIYIKQKLYKTISSFGPLTLKLVNTLTDEFIEIDIDLTIQNYTDITTQVYQWLIEQQENNVNFNTIFPNLEIAQVSGQMLFTPIDENINTDMSVYVFESNNTQFIEDIDNDIQFLNPAINTNNLVFGAQSIGFNEGTGIRVTYRQFKEPLLNQATGVYDGTGNVLDYHTPSGEKYCMKGEIYRLAFQAYDNDSTRLFSIPVGDVMVPNLGDLISSIDDNGTAIITSQKYLNQSVENGILYGHGIKMHFEIRLSCELKKFIPMFQMLFVERTEANRTILCQGIASPLQRIQDNGSNNHRLRDEIRNIWTLPYYGGPTYDANGLNNYDEYGENNQYTGNEGDRRLMISRKLMYFDSPDLYYNKISDLFFNSSVLQIVGKLNTDHTPGVIREHGGDFEGNLGIGSGSANYGNETYPKFSRKILEKQLDGNNHVTNLPRLRYEDGIIAEGFFINVSVYAKYQPYNLQLAIDKSVTMLRGEIKSGAALELDNDLSNNTFGLPSQPWFWSSYARKWTSNGTGYANSDLFAKGSTISPGFKTMFLKTEIDLFTKPFIGSDIHYVDPQIRLGGNAKLVYDTVPLINIFRNNRESVYGGRSQEAYSSNTYIALSKTIPVDKTSNGTQYFDAGADTYMTLNIRVKNDFGENEITNPEYNNGGSSATGEFSAWKRGAAWCYAVVLESQVETKLNYNYEFYRQQNSHNFETFRPEIINEAYFNENNIKSYIPKPFRFKDDPNQDNVIAVSDPKLAGEFYDSWTNFKPNNFYAELEKNKGVVSNLIKQEDSVFAIQEHQISELYIGVDRMISDTEGRPINVKQGSGTVVEGHKVIAPYGTSIRRATVESPYGFVFFDEREVEFVKIQQPLFVQHSLQLDYIKKFLNNPVVDTEVFYDTEYKESNICVKTKNGETFIISYNEVEKCFNGIYECSADVFMNFNKKIYAPIRTAEPLLSEDLHELNSGNELEIFNEQKDLILGFIIHAEIDTVIQYKKIRLITNLDYPVKNIFANSNIGYDRNILGTHEWYQIKEGIHVVPMINDDVSLENISDIRGSWIYVEMTVESLENSKINITSVINELRKSHQ